MIPNKILIYYILILQLLTVKSSYVLIDIFFRKIVIKSPNCYNKDVHFEKYRGAITNFDNIEEDFEKTDYDYEVLTKNITHSFLFFFIKRKIIKIY